MRVKWQNLNSAPRSAFAIRELLAIISTVILVGFLAVPAMSTLRTTQNSTVCLSNQKELIVAWQMYAEENSGRFVENYHGGSTVAFANDPRNAPWACGWLDWGTSPDNTNILYIRSPKYARVSPYFRSDRKVHKCPADNVISSVQRNRGWKERVRSYSMNLTIGNGNALTGPWFPIYKQAKKMDELTFPSPGETSVFLDEHPGSINDPGLFPPGPTSWIDYPSAFHDKAGTIAFADSHVEVHAWRGRIRQSSLNRFAFAGSAAPGDPDHAWLSYHSQRRGAESY